MKRYVFFALAACLAIGGAQGADTQVAPVAGYRTQAAWIQLGPGGQAEVRAVSAGGCPFVVFGDAAKSDVPMVIRASATADFPAVCSLPIPSGVKRVSVAMSRMGEPAHTTMQELHIPLAEPQRILVLGDTGCRIKGTFVQACNDPKAWPFAGLAQAAADQHPDLILHLGDYLYRESPCPADFAGCAGSPYGDNWASWDADFFTPAAPLLAAAPWIVIRGNHEDCNRAGPGFLRLLGPVAYDPAAPCAVHLDPYAVPVGSRTLAILDSADASDRPVDEKAVPLYAKDFETLKAMANAGPGRELWLGTHRPIWAAISFMGIPAGGNATMIEAAGDLSAFSAVSLMLSGHIHAFEAINYVSRIPPQIVAGHGGDTLDVTPANLRGTIFQGDSGVHVKTGFSVGGFGFLMLTREKDSEGWAVQLFDSAGKPIRQCTYANRSIVCLAPK
ncbi:MAG: metallophosphoesterase [Rhizomicrobium sp.]